MIRKLLTLILMVTFSFTVLADSYANGKCCIKNNELEQQQALRQQAENDKDLPPCHKTAEAKSIKKSDLSSKESNKSKDKCCCDYKGCYTKVFINHTVKAYNTELSDIKFFGLKKALEGITPEDTIRPPKQLA